MNITKYPIWQKHQVCMGVDRSNFDPVRYMLKEKYGVVQARNSPLTKDLTIIWPEGRKLVYVDRETGLGIWRADFRVKAEESPYWPNDLISFGYWNLDRSPPHIREEDPMKAALIDAYQILQPQHTTLGYNIGEPVDLGALLGV